jgi:hypothetical protein
MASDGDWGVGSVHVIGSVAFLAGARLLYGIYNRPTTDAPHEYMPWHDGGASLPRDDAVVVDTTHPSLPTLSHHRGSRNPPGLRPGDTSTALVLNALAQSSSWTAGRELAAVAARRYVSSDHFDIDSFLSVWCFINRSTALQHAAGAHPAACRGVLGLIVR